MNGTSWDFSDPYRRKSRFWFYLSLALLAWGLWFVSMDAHNQYIQLAGHVAVVTAFGTILTWVSYTLKHPHPRLIMTLTLLAEAGMFSFGVAQGFLQHALSNFVWG